MRVGWLQRLHAALDEDGRSMRAISTAAGCGPNFVHQMVRNGKEPGADKLARILAVLGRDAALFVMTGVKITQDDLEFISLLQSLSPKSRADALQFFRGLQAEASDQAQAPAADRPETSK